MRQRIRSTAGVALSVSTPEGARAGDSLVAEPALVYSTTFGRGPGASPWLSYHVNRQELTPVGGPGSNGEVNAINHAVSLDGTLEVALLDAYEPDLGESFRIFRFDSLSGDFANFEGFDIGDGKSFVSTFDADSYDLDVAAAGP